MSVSLEKIDMLMERANISYKEAKEALEMHDGDMVEALIYLEASNKTEQSKNTRHQRPQRPQRPNTHQSRRNNQSDFFDEFRKIFGKMHKTNFIIGNKNKKVLDLPLTIAAIIILFTLPFSLFLLILPYIFGYSISILDAEGKNVNFEKTFKFDGEKEASKKEEDRME